MKITEHVSLAEYTTFKTGGPAKFFCSVTTEAELIQAVEYAKSNSLPIFILGGGSNVLISDDGFSGLVIKIDLLGKIYNEDTVTVAAGESWDDFVNETVGRRLYGLENLSAIPGTVGATPVQNIGAYGVEVKEFITRVRAFDITLMDMVSLSNTECAFDYRDSIFKHQKGRYIITQVEFKLSHEPHVNTSYREVSEYLVRNAIANPTPEDVRKAVVDIRWNKLPDWKLWGTAGSFFKNPIITAKHFAKLKTTYPDLPGYPDAAGNVKVSLGWILDHVCNAKGLCEGKVCTYEKQALVLVAKPGATTEEVVNLARKLMDSVKEKTGIEVEGEVEWVN